MNSSKIFRILISLVLVSLSSSEAKEYFINNSTGNDANPGTLYSPWKTFINLKRIRMSPGDVISLARGQVWARDSLQIWWSGTESLPIVIRAYGDETSPRPLIQNIGQVISIWKANYIALNGLAISGSAANCLGMDDSSSNIIIEDFNAFDCGVGLRLSGENIAARNNIIHDLHMVRNTQGEPGSPEANDDYGAIPIMVSNVKRCLIEGNFFRNTRVQSYDYGHDGGAVELAHSVSDCEIRNNFSLNTDGFIEIGGDSHDTVKNITVHHNLALESGVFSFIHGPSDNDKYGVELQNIKFDHNTVITRSRSLSYFVGIGGSLRLGRVLIRNNIFLADSIKKFFFGESQILRKNNLLSGTFGLTEKIWDSANGEVLGNPIFKDESSGKYVLDEQSPGHGMAEVLGYDFDFWETPIPKVHLDQKPDVGAVQSKNGVTVQGDLWTKISKNSISIQPPSDIIGSYKIQLFDLKGRLWREAYCTNEIAVNFESVKSGTYVIRLSAFEKKLAKMVILP